MELSQFNAAAPTVAAHQVRVWANVPRWADAVVAARPYQSVAQLRAHTQALSNDWTETDLDLALADHPRIGERASGSGAHAQASRTEQRAVSVAAQSTVAAIADGNARYEAQFGRVFLIRAAGRSAAEILAALSQRLDNDPATEVSVALGELREIATVRLESDFEENS